MRTSCYNGRNRGNLVYVQHLTGMHVHSHTHLVSFSTNTPYYPREFQLHHPYSWKWLDILAGGHAVARRTHQTLYHYWVGSPRASHREKPSLLVITSVAKKRQRYTAAHHKPPFFEIYLDQDLLLWVYRSLNQGVMKAKARHMTAKPQIEGVEWVTRSQRFSEFVAIVKRLYTFPLITHCNVNNVANLWLTATSFSVSGDLARTRIQITFSPFSPEIHWNLFQGTPAIFSSMTNVNLCWDQHPQAMWGQRGIITRYREPRTSIISCCYLCRFSLFLV